MLPDVRLHVRRNEAGDGLPGLQARADVGGRHVWRCRLDEENHRIDEGNRLADSPEGALMRERWAEMLQCDPYYNPNLSRARADFSLGS